MEARVARDWEGASIQTVRQTEASAAPESQTEGRGGKEGSRGRRKAMISSNGEAGETRWKVRGRREEDSPWSQKRETEREGAEEREKEPRRRPLALNCWTKERGFHPRAWLGEIEEERKKLLSALQKRLKSNIIEGITLDDLETSEDEFFDDDGFEAEYKEEQLQLPSSNVISFDEVLQRRTSVRLNRNRNVTLKDLIRHLEFYEQLEKKQSLKNNLERQKRRVRDYSKLKAKDIVNLAHDEYIEAIVEKMRQNLEQIFKKEQKIELRELTLLGFDKSSAYIAVLFLMVKEDVDIIQEDFYGKLYVTRAQKSLEEEVAN